MADIWSPRDPYSMEEWVTQYGLQKAQGVELYSDDGGSDYQLVTQSGCGAGQTVICVPADIVSNTILNKKVVRWAYNVSRTRFHEVW